MGPATAEADPAGRAWRLSPGGRVVAGWHLADHPRPAAGRGICAPPRKTIPTGAMPNHPMTPATDAALRREAAQDAAASDEALLVAFGNGDMSAARLLTERLGPRVLRYATRLLGGDRAEAEDVTQEAMLRLWKLAPDWRQGEAKVTSWLYRVTANLCTDRLRKRRWQGPPLDEIAEPPDEAATPAEAMDARQRAEALDAALAQLPERQRQAVVLRHIEGLANPEIAAVMDIGVEAVESLTARGKRTLASILAGRREELGYGA